MRECDERCVDVEGLFVHDGPFSNESVWLYVMKEVVYTYKFDRALFRCYRLCRVIWMSLFTALGWILYKTKAIITQSSKDRRGKTGISIIILVPVVQALKKSFSRQWVKINIAGALISVSYTSVNFSRS